MLSLWTLTLRVWWSGLNCAQWAFDVPKSACHSPTAQLSPPETPLVSSPETTVVSLPLTLIEPKPVPQLFFSQLNYGPWLCEMSSKTEDILIDAGWTMLNMSLPHHKGYAEGHDPNFWFDTDHPRAEVVYLMMDNYLSQMRQHGVSDEGMIVLIGDSTTTYALRPACEIRVGQFYDAVFKQTKYHVMHCGVSGSSFDSSDKKAGFEQQLVQAVETAAYNPTWGPIRAILLVGGWNQWSLEGLDSKVAALTAKAVAACT